MTIEFHKYNVSKNYYKQWTPTAIYCYERGCKCKDCPINKVLETKCLMKTSVLFLVKNLGKPKIKSIDEIHHGAD